MKHKIMYAVAMLSISLLLSVRASEGYDAQKEPSSVSRSYRVSRPLADISVSRTHFVSRKLSGAYKQTKDIQNPSDGLCIDLPSIPIIAWMYKDSRGDAGRVHSVIKAKVENLSIDLSPRGLTGSDMMPSMNLNLREYAIIKEFIERLDVGPVPQTPPSNMLLVQRGLGTHFSQIRKNNKYNLEQMD